MKIIFLNHEFVAKWFSDLDKWRKSLDRVLFSYKVKKRRFFNLVPGKINRSFSRVYLDLTRPFLQKLEVLTILKMYVSILLNLAD